MAEISIEEMYGSAAPTKPEASNVPGGTEISVEEMFGGKAPAAPPVHPPGFLARTKKAVGQAADIIQHGTLDEKLRANVGLAKAVGGGMVDMAQLAMEGVRGLIAARTMKEGTTYVDRFMRGKESATGEAQQLREFASQVSKVNLAPQGKEEEAMFELLGVLPDAITAAGDTVYDKTGSALLGAGTQGALTLLTLKPGIAAKPLRSLGRAATAKTPGANAAAAKIQSTFDDLSIRDPDAAAALIEHVSKADPTLAADMTKRLETARKKSTEELKVDGERAAKAELVEQSELRLAKLEEQQALALERIPTEQKALALQGGKSGNVLPRRQMTEQLEAPVEGSGQLSLKFDREGIKHEMDTDTGEHRITSPNGEMLLQESGNRLQVKRIDVAKAAQKKGEGSRMLQRAIEEADRQGMPLMSDVSVSPAAEALYKRLEKSREYEVRRNPSERSETTGNLVSKDPRLGVFEVRRRRGTPQQKRMDLEDTQPRSTSPLEMPPPSPEQQLALGIDTAQPPKGRVGGAQRELALPRGTAGTQMRFPAEALGSGIRKAVAQGYDVLDKPSRIPKDAPTLFTENGVPVKTVEVRQSFNFGKKMDAIPGWAFVKGKLQEYYNQLVQTFNPEGFGYEAKAGAAVLAKNMAIQMQKDSQFHHRSMIRRKFWNQHAAEAPEFIRKFEKGEKFEDPLLNEAAEAYRTWNKEIFETEQKLGVDYVPEDNYLYHLFEDSKGLENFFNQKYGNKWGKPGFVKERSFDLYDQAIKAGFKPKFTNPEDIMLARQHASDIAEMRIQSLRDMEQFGFAKKISKDDKAPPDWPAHQWRAPNGERFFVHERASAVLNNAFNTQSLWTLKGIAGDAFRGMMELKNTIVPIKLALSLFHPLHVLTIHNATGMVRASKALLAKTIGPAAWLKEMAKATVYADFISAPRTGGRLLRAFQGKIKDAEITAMDRQALQFMFEGGFTPEMPAQYKTGAINRFRESLQKGQARAAWHLPMAAIQLLQKPMFEVWIPSLKIASYLKDVRTALRIDPSLNGDPLRRQMLFRKLAKSVDNRYGEMAYNTLFWNRWVKDLAVANTLSLGWQLGFIREYGGGMLDIGQFSKKGIAQRVKAGELDRPLFVTFYTTQALMYGGLMTWALSGEAPANLLDYTFPKNGETNPDETPQRVSTMLYPREFVAIYKHMEHEGVLPGLGHLAANKASGTVGLVRDWATGVNSFGQEIRDPAAPAYQQLAQTLAYTLGDLEPISVGDIREKVTEKPLKHGVMSVAGFSTAPKYITETTTQAHIKQSYQKYVSPKETPYEKALFSNEMRRLRRFYEADRMEDYDNLLDTMTEKFELSPKDTLRIKKQALKSEEAGVAMFKRLPWQVQKKLLDEMDEEEREIYLPASSKDHLRFRYEPPEERAE